MNARPLIPVTSDSESTLILTPSMLLTLKTGSTPPPPGNFEGGARYKEEWKRVQNLADIFWGKWRREYLHTLQLRQKWQDKKPSLKCRDTTRSTPSPNQSDDPQHTSHLHPTNQTTRSTPHTFTQPIRRNRTPSPNQSDATAAACIPAHSSSGRVDVRFMCNTSKTEMPGRDVTDSYVPGERGQIPTFQGEGEQEGEQEDEDRETVDRWELGEEDEEEENHDEEDARQLQETILKESKVSKGREEKRQRLLQEMSLEDHRRLTAGLLERQPGLIFNLLMEHQQRHGAPTSAEVSGVPWCTCGHCRDMPTDRERKCCGQDPAHCVSLLPHFTQYCLDEGYLRIHRQYREDLTAFGDVREPGDDKRHAAYRHFIFWQHGSLGQGNRRVIPSCCVCRIRGKFPDPQGQYTGYIPGI
ncbi:uncharacterized protein LOC121713243 [Alosa sapidissima]|uniref:uncharacterized protein LOC121713243 n=1 Tax=Alosa sapidissima TaxID=34773 RepID=UPI001C09C51C|nr:uncharacterized protein LOC121713243 [Alosa sapidissima]